MCFLILLFPFLSFLTTNLLGRSIGVFGSRILSTFSILISFVLSLFVFYESAVSGSICTINALSWINIELFVTPWAFCFDPLSTTMLLVVCGVSSLVHLYSIEYMLNDPHAARFMGYLSLFTFFMLILVTADNFLVMFLGWEGIGLASYLLISFWHTRIQAGKSAIKAMLVNRVGDLGLVLAICSIFISFKSLDYSVVFLLNNFATESSFSFLFFNNADRLSVITFFIFWGALGKSAQIGLHIWLPDAMEGPTPVSALIHAATLVTAGIFLIIRCSVLFEECPTILSIIALIGSLTAFFAASIGLVQNDLKKVIAYSTCSQLGFMMFACGLSHYSIALFHLANHALFKALLFLSAGCVIHGLLDEQDLRKMGGLVQVLPVSYTMILIGSLALVGFPFLTGFYSKDVVLEIALANPTFIGNFVHWLGCSAAFCTSFYSFRLIFLTFLNHTNTSKTYIENAHEAPLIMVLPLTFLAFGSIFWGYFSKDLFIGVGTSFFLNSITTNFENLYLLEAEFAPTILKNVPFIFTLFGGLISFFLINCSVTSKSVIFSYKTTNSYKRFYNFLTKRWHFDQLGNEIIIHKLMNFGYSISFQIFDKGFIEIFGPFGSALTFWDGSKSLSKLHSGMVFHYCFIMLFFIFFSLYYFVACNLDWSVNSIIILLIFSYSISTIK
nr:NADH dehydrogenase subunit 5 [Phaeocystis rex]